MVSLLLPVIYLAFISLGLPDALLGAAWPSMYLGLGGAVTYTGAKRAARVLAAIPHDRALLETDCPYMAPEPVRGTRNDSRNIVHVAAYIGTLWDMDAQAVLDQTAANARACFGV